MSTVTWPGQWITYQIKIKITISRKLVARLSQIFNVCRGDNPLARTSLQQNKIWTVYLFQNLFLTPPQTVNLGPLSLRSFVAHSKRIRQGKSSGKLLRFPLNEGKLSKRKVLSYMGARVLCARGSTMSIFRKKFQCVTFLCKFNSCALLMTSLIIGELEEPKVGPWLGGLLVEHRTSVSQIRGSIPGQVAAV